MAHEPLVAEMQRLARGWLVVALAGAALGACAGGASSGSNGSGGDDGGNGLCSLDNECTSGQRCRGGVCQPLECTVRQDCVGGTRVCADGECVLYNPASGCASTEDCPSPYLCDGFSRGCFDPNTGMFLGSSSGSTSSGASSSSSSSGSSSASSSSSSSSSGGGGPVNLAGWQIENEENGNVIQSAVIPNNTVVAAGGTVIIARDANKAQFESFWGVSLPSNVVFLKSGNPNSGIPVINNNEKFSIYRPPHVLEDGPTVKGATGHCYQRTRASSPGSAGSWGEVDESQATPGSAALAGSDRGVFVSEWCDASGTGNYIYEFIELYVNP